MTKSPVIEKEERFPTRLGPMRALWSEGELCSLKFFEEGSEESASHDTTNCTSPLAQTIQKHFAGDSQDFDGLKLHPDLGTEFARKVYRQARRIPAGNITTYGEIASDLGKPGSSRAVGTALGKNPILVIIPCHRVLARGGKLGGFSAPGGLETKQMLLAAEGYGVESLWESNQLERGYQQLLTCPKLGPVVEKIGRCPLQPLYPQSPFGALARAVLYQQLATGAAKAIENRVKALGSAPFPTADELQKLTVDRLRTAGVSGPKIATLKRLAEATMSGSLKPEQLRFLPNERIEREISSLKGLGNWTARMFLLFHLGRRDIFPVKDLGIRKGVQQLYKTKDLPAQDFMERKSRPWKPYRSLASWYLWRSLDS